MPHYPANTPCWFLLWSVSAWPQPSTLPVLRQKCGLWAEEMSVTLALEAFSTEGPPPAPLPWLVGRPGPSRSGFLSLLALSGGTGSQCSALPLGVAVSLW